MNNLQQAVETNEAKVRYPKTVLILNYHEVTEDPRVFKQARALVNAGHYVYVMCRWLAGYPKFDKVDGVRICRFDCFSPSHISQMDLASFWFLQNSLGEVRSRYMPYAVETEKLAALDHAKTWVSDHYDAAVLKYDKIRRNHQMSDKLGPATSDAVDSSVSELLAKQQAERALSRTWTIFNEKVRRWKESLDAAMDNSVPVGERIRGYFAEPTLADTLDQSGKPEQILQEIIAACETELKTWRQSRDRVRIERDLVREDLSAAAETFPSAMAQVEKALRKPVVVKKEGIEGPRTKLLAVKAARSKVFREVSEQKRVVQDHFRNLYQVSAVIFGINLARETLPCTPDLVHAHDFYTLPGGILLAQRFGANVLYDAHEYEPGRASKMPPEGPGLVDKMELDCLRHVDRMTTVAPSIGDLYAERFPGPPPEIILNAPEIDLACLQTNAAQSDLPTLREKTGLSADVKVIVFTGGVQREKRGLDLVVAALVALPTYHLVILGPRLESDDEWLTNHAREIGVDDRIHLLPKVDARDVVVSIRDADVAVCPIQDAGISYRYCLPNKLFEAAFAQIPLCVSDLPELGRFVSELGIGRTMDQTDPKSIANALRDVAENRETYVMTEAAKAVLISKYSWQAQVVRLNELVAEFLHPLDPTVQKNGMERRS